MEFADTSFDLKAQTISLFKLCIGVWPIHDYYTMDVATFEIKTEPCTLTQGFLELPALTIA